MPRESYGFNKINNEWFIDLPEYIEAGGNQADLQMIAGADIFLDILAKGNLNVKMKISDKEFKDAERLYLLELGDIDGPECGTGAWYILKSYDGKEVKVNFKMWLCEVTRFIFGYFPFVIYFKNNI